MVANLDDVIGLMAGLDAQISAANAAVQGCASMPGGDHQSWEGFYQQWEAEKDKINSYVNAPWYNLGAKVDEVILATSFYGELQGFASQFAAWQPILAKDCPGYSAPPSPIPPTPAGPPPIDWNNLVKWGAIGVAGIAGIYLIKTVKDILP